MPDQPIHRRFITPPSVLPSKNFGILPEAFSWSPDTLEVTDASLHPTRQQSFPRLPAKISAGSVIDDFRIIREIGSGGMASIYQAMQVSRDREVALKILSPHLSHVPAAIERFRREADLLARLDHPGIVPIYRRGAARGYTFYAMKLLAGPTLAEFIDQAEGVRGEAFFREAAILFAALARTLAALHTKGIVHQDIKPSNLILTHDKNSTNRLVLTDFGIAVEIGKAQDPIALEGQPLMQGTPAYMAPEKFIPGKNAPDARADIYSLGLCLFELVTGSLPFPECSDEEMARLKLAQKPPSPRALLPTVPLGLEAIIRQATGSHVAMRYQSAGDMALDLDRFANNRRPNSRKHTRAGSQILEDPHREEQQDERQDEDGDPEMAKL
jgi:serine/threonine-protein kinase